MAERKEMNVVLIRHTLSPEETIALGAKLCYSKATIEALQDKIEKKDQSAFIGKLMDMGHESVLEHASFTFGVEGVSRALLAQITRHRVASFSVQSQRYVSYENGFGYIVPPAIEALGENAVAKYEQQMNIIEGWYKNWQEALGKKGEKSNEDARFVLPNACETRMIVTMNVRELRHFFSLRMCSRAQWEIRALATRMHKLCMDVAPELFANAGPACLRGKCPEGDKSCGRGKELREARKNMLAFYFHTSANEMQSLKAGDTFYVKGESHTAMTDARIVPHELFGVFDVFGVSDENGKLWVESDFDIPF